MSAKPKPSTWPARLAPPDSTYEWNDQAGSHEVTIGSDGIFQPADALEAAHADRLEWPLAPAKPAKADKAKEND